MAETLKSLAFSADAKWGRKWEGRKGRREGGGGRGGGGKGEGGNEKWVRGSKQG